MDSILLDNEHLSAQLPEGFETLSHTELVDLTKLDYDCMWGARNTQTHEVMWLTWKDSSKLLTKLVSEKSLAKRVDKANAAHYRSYGYRSSEYFSRSIAGADREAQGFRFSYTIDGIEQEGEVLVFMLGKRCYTLGYYTRSEVASQNRPAHDGFVSSLTLRN